MAPEMSKRMRVQKVELDRIERHRDLPRLLGKSPEDPLIVPPGLMPCLHRTRRLLHSRVVLPGYSPDSQRGKVPLALPYFEFRPPSDSKLPPAGRCYRLRRDLDTASSGPAATSGARSSRAKPSFAET